MIDGIVAMTLVIVKMIRIWRTDVMPLVYMEGYIKAKAGGEYGEI